MSTHCRPSARLAALAAAVVAACSSGTEPPTATSIQISSSQGTGGVALAALGQAIQLTAKVLDQHGDSMPGVAVTWSTSSPATATVSVSGLVTAVGNGSAQITASAGASVTKSVTATVVQTPALLTKTGGDGQSGLVSATLPTALTVRVADALDHPITGVSVAFSVSGGGGSVSPATASTGATGAASTSWTLGAGSGAHSVTASVSAGTSTLTAVFGATAAAYTLTPLTATTQTALVGFPVNVRPAVLVKDAGSNPAANVSVTFAVSGGGGSLTGGTATTDAQGIARVGSWTVGVTPGANTLMASLTGTGVSVTFSATAASAAYNIVVRNIGPAFTPTVQAAFDAAEAQWEQIIYGDQADWPVNTTSACGFPAGSGGTIQETVDDVVILVRFDAIDGPGNILGQAGACRLRDTNGLPVYGQMVFDTADVASLGANLNAVILHEMGHVLGFSSGIFNSGAGVGSPVTCAQLITGPGLDSHFSCTQPGAQNYAVAMFDLIGGTNYTGGSKVPLENCVSGVPSSCGAGTLFSHWRESTFFNELMTGYLNSGAPSNPLSVLTITAMQDIGYQVNYAAAQAYTRTFTAAVAARGPVIDLSNDEYRGPIEIVDRNGRVVRVIRR